MEFLLYESMYKKFITNDLCVLKKQFVGNKEYTFANVFGQCMLSLASLIIEFLPSASTYIISFVLIFITSPSLLIEIG